MSFKFNSIYFVHIIIYYNSFIFLFWKPTLANKWVMRYDEHWILRTEKMRATYNTTSSKVHTMHHIPSTTSTLLLYTFVNLKLLDFSWKKTFFSFRLAFFTKNGEWFKNHEKKIVFVVAACIVASTRLYSRLKSFVYSLPSQTLCYYTLLCYVHVHKQVVKDS